MMFIKSKKTKKNVPHRRKAAKPAVGKNLVIMRACRSDKAGDTLISDVSNLRGKRLNRQSLAAVDSWEDKITKLEGRMCSQVN
jgi:hypothetical protein